MSIKIEKKEAFTVIGMKVRTNMKNVMKNCSIIWEKMMPLFKKIPERIPGYGISYDCSPKCEEFTYMGAMPLQDDTPKGCEKLEVPSATYAVFEHKGKAESISNTYKKAMKEIQEEGLEFDTTKMNIEYYPPEFRNQDDSVCEIWLAVKE